jgi:protein arginine kinase activator
MSMFCQNCGKVQANVHVNNPDGVVHYCQNCAIQKLQQNSDDCMQFHQQCANINMNMNANLPNSAMGINQPLIAIIPVLEMQNVSTSVPDITCKRCNCTFNEFLIQGRFSCPECYEAFAQQIRHHKTATGEKNRYCGKFPARAYRHLQLLRQIQYLKLRLNEEVKKENYDNAVRLRDTIKDLEKEVEQSIKSTSVD